MEKFLVIVESPTKIKTLKKFLGPKFIFVSSMGHIRDLPEKEFGIDIEHDFEPKYVNLPDKKETITKLKAAAKEASIIYLSPDPDREGEAIAWHIVSILPKTAKIKRMVFNSITKSAVQEALNNPRDLDLALVNAQQARRLLDRMVGYKISPILTKKLRRGKGTSAGRVQSVALKLVVEREKEIESFKSTEYWTIKTILHDDGPSFEAILFSVAGKKVEKEKSENNFVIGDEKSANEIVKKLKEASYKVTKVEKKEKKRYPVPPFITSTLQQEASRHFGFPVSRTMNIAQGLYEGVDMKKEGTEGLITYMRTDSVKVADEAVQMARDFILSHYGKEYLPEKGIYYTSKKSAQEAHEAIRPTNLAHPPEKIKSYLTPEQFKLYSLIWKRFLASQMNPAVYDTISADIETDKNMQLRANGSLMKFNGFLVLYEEKNDQKEEEEKELPDLKENTTLVLEQVIPNQSFTKPPPRFTEASLVKELEKRGIGRPSTYASIMNKIQSREYTYKKEHVLIPTELGKIIVQMLEENFQGIMNVDFTAQMEDQLELIAENKKEWRDVLRIFWKNFFPMVEKAEKEAKVPKQMTNIPCPKCKKPLQKIWSKNKYFYGCSNYPECDFTSPLEALNFKKEDYAEDFDWNQKCPKCGSQTTLRHGRFGPFLGCLKYPKCKGIINIPKKGEEIFEEPNCPAIGCDGKIVKRRSRYGKIFFSCSNFPDCDVIVNDLKDLETKYDANHPKTAYVKKGKFSKTYKLSPELASLLNAKELSRGEVLKQLWVYIKAHKLQDGRKITPDEKLAKVFGSTDTIDMMQIARLISPHLKQ